MICFVDTSALFAVIDRDDHNHDRANRAWQRLITDGDTLISTNYVLLETSALIQNRIGLDALRVLYQDVMPVLVIHWVDETAHSAAISAVLTGARKSISLVDSVSFNMMRQNGIQNAFTYDKHFAEQKFVCIQ